MNYEERIKGALFGFALGDALGATTEFMSKSSIKAMGGINNITGGGWLNLEQGEVTDDTEMMLLVGNALAKSRKEYTFLGKCADGFIKWLKSSPRDVGNCCFSVINRVIEINRRRQKDWGLSVRDWFRISRDANKKRKSLGNGGLMRAVPTCLIRDEGDSIIFSRSQSELTHYNQISSRCVEIYAQCFKECEGKTEFQSKFVIQEKIAENLEMFENFCEFDDDNNVESSGHVCNTLYLALEAIVKAQSFKECILSIANEGGDSDTIAAISGGLYGFIVGYEKLPKEFLEKLKPYVKEELLNVSSKLSKVL